MKIKFKETDSKIYSIINSKGLVGYFVNFQNIIQTTFDKRNNSVNYYFNLQKKNKEKIYQYKKINNIIDAKKLKFNKGVEYQTIEPSHLGNTVDPLVAVKQILFNDKLNSKCNGNTKIYDGDDVYRVYLTPKKMNKLQVDYGKIKYQTTFACRVNYEAISGHKLKRTAKLNSLYLDVYFSKVNSKLIPVYFETKAKVIPIKMYLSTVLSP